MGFIGLKIIYREYMRNVRCPTYDIVILFNSHLGENKYVQRG